MHSLTLDGLVVGDYTLTNPTFSRMKQKGHDLQTDSVIEMKAMHDATVML